MSITDELRQVAAKTEEANGRCGKLYRGDLDRIADRIDATYEADVNTACKLANALSADELTEHGWVKLPVDADGVPIRVGDELCGYGRPKGGVFAKAITSQMILVGEPQDSYRNWLLWNALDCRHYHEPTVEDVLRDFGADIARALDADPDATVPETIIAEYAAKLRLAGEGE